MRRIRAFIVPVVGVVMLLAAACGGAENGDSAQPVPDTPTDAAKPSPQVVSQIPRISEPDAEPVKDTFVTEIGTANKPYLALVAQGDTLVAYVCDGANFSDWFGGQIIHGRFNARSGHGTMIEGTLGDGRISGTIALPNATPIGFEARRAERGKTGLFVHDDYPEVGFKARWIVTSNGIRGLSDNGTGQTKGAVTATGTSSGGGAEAGATSGGGGGATTTTTAGTSRCINAVSGGCNMSCAQIEQGIQEASKLIRSGLLSKEGLQMTIDIQADFMLQASINKC